MTEQSRESTSPGQWEQAPSEWVIVRFWDEAGVRVREEGFEPPSAPPPGISPAGWRALHRTLEKVHSLLQQYDAIPFPRPTVELDYSAPDQEASDLEPCRLLALDVPASEIPEEARARLAEIDLVQNVYWPGEDHFDWKPVVQVGWPSEKDELPQGLKDWADEQDVCILALRAHRVTSLWRVMLDLPRVVMVRFEQPAAEFAEWLKERGAHLYQPASEDAREVLLEVWDDPDPAEFFDGLPYLDIHELAMDEIGAIPDLSQYFSVHADPGAHPALIADLVEESWVKTAYTAPRPAPPPSSIPNYYRPPQAKQPHLAGIKAAAAWDQFDPTQDCGQGVTVALIDHAWDTDHVDLAGAGILQPPPGYGPVASAEILENRDHGLASLGVLLARHEADEASEIGMRGIVPGATVRLLAAHPTCAAHLDVAASIWRAITLLNKGDVILLEQQAETEPGNEIFAPVEHHCAEWDAIVAATGGYKKLIVVEPAGNGDRELVSQGPLSGNAVRLHAADEEHADRGPSGALLVGAGESASRRRCTGSNYGDMIDLQAQGEAVGTLGYTDLRSSPANERYTEGETFRLTSSAAAIVAGIVAALQSIRKRDGRPVLTPDDVRDLLSNPDNGSRQLGDLAEHIGPRPDLEKLIQAL